MKKRIISLTLCFVLLAFSCSTAYAKPTNDEIDAQARGTDSCVTSIGNTIYYIDGDWIYSMNSTGKNRKKEVYVGIDTERTIYENTTGLQSYNGYLYYSSRTILSMLNPEINEGGTVYRYKPGGKPAVFLSDAVRDFIIGDNTLYYGTIDGSRIKSVNLDTGKKETLVEGNASYRISVVTFLEDVLAINVDTPDNDFLALYNPKTKELVEHRELNGATHPFLFQTRGSFLYDFDAETGHLYRSALNHSTLAITARQAFIDLGQGDGTFNGIFISGDYVYYGIVDLENDRTDWYKRHLGTGKTTFLYSQGAKEAWYSIVQPFGNYIHRWKIERLTMYSVDNPDGMSGEVGINPQYVRHMSK